jgi:hypothetical protein
MLIFLNKEVKIKLEGGNRSLAEYCYSFFSPNKHISWFLCRG